MCHFYRFPVFLLILCLTSVTGSGLQAADKPWGTDPERALQAAARSGRPVFMQFSASWCAICKRLEKTTLADPNVAARISNDYVPVRIDVDLHKDLAKDLEIKGLPAVLIVSPDLEILHRIAGFRTVDAMLEELDAAEKAAATIKNKTAPRTANRNASDADEDQEMLPIRTPARSASRTRSGEELDEEPFPRATSVSKPAVRPETATKSRAATAARRNIDDLPDDFLRMVEQEKALAKKSVPRPTTSHAAGSRSGTRDDDASPRDDTLELSSERTRSTSSPRGTPARRAAFDGSSLVSAVDDRVIENGSIKYQTTFRGQTLYFTSDRQRRLFEDDPEHYWPALDGNCPLTLLRTDRREPGKLEHAAVFRGQVWLFATDADMQEFIGSPSAVIEDVREVTGE